MSTGPEQREHTDGHDHPSWCAPALCELDESSGDLVHAGIPQPVATGYEGQVLLVARVRSDEVWGDGTQHPGEHQVSVLDPALDPADRRRLFIVVADVARELAQAITDAADGVK